MGYILFWIEAVVASVLWVALGQSLAARVARRWRRGLLKLAAWLLALLPWAAAIALLRYVDALFGGARQEVITTAVAAGVVVVLAAVVVWLVGRRVAGGGPPVCRATAWRPGRLAVAFAVALLLTAMTYWNLDLAVQQEMAALKGDVSAQTAWVQPAQIPESMNAAPVYQQAAEMLEASLGDKWRDRVAFWPADPTNQELLADLQRQQGVISVLKEAGRRVGFNAGWGHATGYGELNNYTRMTWLLNLDACAKAHYGQMADAMDDITAGLAMAHNVGIEPGLVAHLVSLKCDFSAVRGLELALNAGTVSTEDLRRLVIPPESFGRSFQRSLLMERAWGLSVFARPGVMGSVQGIQDGESASGRCVALWESPWRTFLWRQDMNSYTQHMSVVTRLAEQPYFEARTGWERQSGPRQGLVMSVIAPGLAKAAVITAAAQARHRQAQLAKAMWQYRLAEGRFPTDLSQLAPQYLPSVPVDPFTGEPMKLKISDDGSVIVYSAGPDLDDDDGGRDIDYSNQASNGWPGDGDVVFVVYRAGPEPAPAPQTQTAPSEPR
jgi:hypothetical protein